MRTRLPGLRPTLALAVGATLALAGCARDAAGATAGSRGAAGEILDGRTGEPVSFDALVADLASARVVYVGEEHTNAADHEAQRAILLALRAARPDDALALGLEMVQRPFQPALDAWNAGDASEAELRAGVEWEDRWGYDYGLYRSILDAARDRGVRVVGLNAPREVTRAIGHGGVEALDDGQRAELPELDLEDPGHREMVMAALAGHGGADEAMLERFYVAQVVWDETMAATVAEALDAGADRVVALAGRFHVRRGLGIPKRAARRGAAPYRVVLPLAPEEVEGALAEQDPPAADYLWVRGR